MKFSSKIFIGVASLGVLGVGAFMLSDLGKSTLGDKANKFFSYKVYAAAFGKIGGTTNFRNLSLTPGKKIFSSTVSLDPAAKRGDGSSISTKNLLEEIKAMDLGKGLDYGTYRENYLFDNANRAQLKVLLGIIRDYPTVSYFVFEPTDGNDFDTSLAGVLCYRIIPTASDGNPVKVDSTSVAVSNKIAIDARALEFIPCPPGSTMTMR